MAFIDIFCKKKVKIFKFISLICSFQVLINNITRTEKTGTYDQNVLKPLSDSLLIEMSIAVPDSKEYLPAAKILRDFSDQVLPYVIFIFSQDFRFYRISKILEWDGNG